MGAKVTCSNTQQGVNLSMKLLLVVMSFGGAGATRVQRERGREGERERGRERGREGEREKWSTHLQSSLHMTVASVPWGQGCRR